MMSIDELLDNLADERVYSRPVGCDAEHKLWTACLRLMVDDALEVASLNSLDEALDHPCYDAFLQVYGNGYQLKWACQQSGFDSVKVSSWFKNKIASKDWHKA